MRSASIVLVALAAPALSIAGPAAGARTSLGVFERWGAFADPAVPRCYAISTPARTGPVAGWSPFAAVGYWPRAGVRGQVHIRLSRMAMPNAPIMLAAGTLRVPLVGRGADAWAPDARSDAAILAAMRSAAMLRVTARATSGLFTESYPLRGAATAIDAATLGCGRFR